MKNIKIIISFLFISCCIQLSGQNKIYNQLVDQGIWFLESTEIKETYDEQNIIQKEYFKKDDVSSLFFEPTKLYTVYSKIGNEVFEDRWKLIDDTHFVMVGQDDESSQIMVIQELTPDKLIIESCNDIEGSISCTKFTYKATKDNWLSDKEIESLNNAESVITGESNND